ncbi:bifunctional diguanylate cyclase/phosphodiesterase [Neptuniibacter caesariensis]|uniref:Sensory box protein n=1 Tax=Neptuniibacter caesariensis TaxID=207954 RepID=A0A7U8C3I2_NEPCE|nr:diguanylate cyclase [Neptuniibacter caesariensis]EAR60773.1 sensory box protein [Neptuniibacter caesariensis]
MNSGDTQTNSELTILDHIDDLVSIVDNTYTYRAVSKGYELFFNCKKEEIIGQTVAEVHGEEVFIQQIKPSLDRTLAGDEIRFQFSRPAADGSIHYLDSKHSLYQGPLTRGNGVVVAVRDITPFVTAKHALEHEQALLKKIINSIPDFIFAKDPNGVYQLCNESFQRFLDMSQDEIIGKTDFEIMSVESAEYVTNKDSEVKNTRKPHRCDEWVTYKDGRRRLLDMYKLPLAEDEVSPPGVLGLGRNVTFEREAEQNLLMASLVFDATPDPCLILSSDGTIISSNEAAKLQFTELELDSTLTLNDLFYCPASKEIDLDYLISEGGSWCGEICSSDNYTFLATINAVQGQSLQENKFVLIVRDEHTHRRMKDNLLTKAYQDALTGLPNRRLFFSRLESAISRAERQLSQLGVLYIDLDNFKPVNDQHGHLIGDKALREIAKRLQNSFRTSDTLARLGGDEFIALVDIDKRDQASSIALKVSECLNQPMQLSPDIETSLSASIGISIFPGDGANAEELIHKADEAMYKAKRAEGSVFQFASET